jgi:drug/metabolite transporter (DMT)-like permease
VPDPAPAPDPTARGTVFDARTAAEALVPRAAAGSPPAASSPSGAPVPDVAAERRALWLLVLSSVCFGLMAFAAKLAATSGMGGAQVAAVRFASGLLPVLLLPGVRRRALTWQRLDLLFYRGVFGGVAVLLYFLAIDHVPVGLATLLNYTSPIFAGVFAALFIGEPVRARALPALAVAMAGVFLVVRSHAGGAWLGALGVWTAVGLVSAVLSGAAVTAIRVARRTESSWAVYTSFNVLGLLATAPFALAAWQRPGVAGWLALAAVALTSMAAQLLMTHAYRWVDNLRAGVVAQLAVFIAMACGAAFLGEPVTPGSLFGSLLTVAGVLAVVAGQGRRPSPGRPLDP